MREACSCCSYTGGESNRAVGIPKGDSDCYPLGGVVLCTHGSFWSLGKYLRSWKGVWGITTAERRPGKEKALNTGERCRPPEIFQKIDSVPPLAHRNLGAKPLTSFSTAAIVHSSILHRNGHFCDCRSSGGRSAPERAADAYGQEEDSYPGSWPAAHPAQHYLDHDCRRPGNRQ